MSYATGQQSLKAYSNASQTLGKTRQVVMLYDGAIRFLQQASDAMGNGDAEQRYNRLTKTSEIIMALQACLDFDARSDAAHVLNDFYSSIIVQIMSLHRTSDRSLCTRIIAELKVMRDTWDTIDRGMIATQSYIATSPVAIADPASMG